MAQERAASEPEGRGLGRAAWSPASSRERERSSRDSRLQRNQSSSRSARSLPQVSSEGTGRRASLSPLSECGPQRGGRKSPWGPSPRPPALPRGLLASLSSGHEQGEQGPWVTPVVPRWGVIHPGGGVALERKGLEGGGPRVHLALDKKPPPGCAPA